MRAAVLACARSVPCRRPWHRAFPRSVGEAATRLRFTRLRSPRRLHPARRLRSARRLHTTRLLHSAHGRARHVTSHLRTVGSSSFRTSHRPLNVVLRLPGSSSHSRGRHPSSGAFRSMWNDSRRRQGLIPAGEGFLPTCGHTSAVKARGRRHPRNDRAHSASRWRRRGALTRVHTEHRVARRSHANSTHGSIREIPR